MRKILLLLLVLLFILSACDTGSSPKNEFGMKDLGWITRHVHSESFEHSAYLYIQVPLNDYTGNTDVSYINIELDGVDISSQRFSGRYDSNNNRFLMFLSDDSFLPDYSALYTGEYSVILQFTDGTTDRKSFIHGVPGSSEYGGITTLYASNNDDTKNAAWSPLLAIADITSASIDSNVLNITFSVDDNRVYSGSFLLYQGDEIIGYIIGLEDLSGTLHKNGTSSTYTLPSSEFTFSEGTNLSDATDVIVMLTDGEQFIGVYDDEYLHFDHESYSLKYTIGD